MNSQVRAILLGGILPVVLFTVIEQYYGTIAGLIAGMVFGAGEIAWEWWKQRRVETMTWIGNGMLLVLGGVSLFTREGVWFKLQPALLEALMGAVLLGSTLLGKSLLLAMSEKQGALTKMPPEIRAIFTASLSAMTIRLSVFFFAHAALAVWAALKWSTAAWAILKGGGFTGSMILYVLIEGGLLRRRIQSIKPVAVPFDSVSR